MKVSQSNRFVILLKREVLQHGKQLTIGGHSPAVSQMLEFCRLVGVFGDPMIIPADA